MKFKNIVLLVGIMWILLGADSALAWDTSTQTTGSTGLGLEQMSISQTHTASAGQTLRAYSIQFKATSMMFSTSYTITAKRVGESEVTLATGTLPGDTTVSKTVNCNFYGYDGDDVIITFKVGGGNLVSLQSLTTNCYIIENVSPITGLTPSISGRNVYWSWQSATNAESYDVYIDDVLKYTGANTYYTHTNAPAHGNSNIKVIAKNSAYTATAVTQSATLSNNPITITGLSNIIVTEGGLVSINADASDIDGDAPTFSCSRNDLFTDFDTDTGTGTWIPNYGDSGTYSIDFTVSDGYGSTDVETITITVNPLVPSSPTNLQNSSGNFFVDWSWVSGENTDSFNVSLNDVWYNGSTTDSIRHTPLVPHATSMIKIYAYNESSKTLSDPITSNTQLINNPITLSGLSNKFIYEGQTVVINAEFTDLDNDEVTFSCNRTDLFGNFNTATGEGSWQTDSASSGTYEVTFTVDDGYGSTDSQTITITVNEYTLQTPVLSNVSGNFFVDWSWNSVANADSYNVSLNGVWTNGTAITEINNTDMDAHGTSTIQVFAYNETSDILSEVITDSVTLENNPVSIINLNDISINEGDLVEIDANFLDLDNDEVTFSCNRTDLFGDFNTATGVGSWQTTFDDSGVYQVTFGVSDGHGSMDSQTVTITVNDVNRPPSTPTGFTNLGMYLTDHTPTISWTKGTDGDGDTVYTYIYVGTTSTPTTLEAVSEASSIDLGNGVSFVDGQTYYYRLRSFDGIDYSDYTIADEFSMNDIPTNPVITGRTTYHNYTNEEEVSWISTDTDDQSLNYYIFIYKGETLTSNLNGAWNSYNFELVPPYDMHFDVKSYDGTEFSGVTRHTIEFVNNAPVLSPIADITVNEGQLVSFNVDATDHDGDSVTFSCDRTDLFGDFNTATGEGSWQTDSSDSGTYEVTFTVDDGYESTDSQTITITVNEYSLSTPVLSNASGNFFVDWSWNSVANADSYNVSLNDIWTNGTTVTEINNTGMFPHGTSTIRVLAYNATSDILSGIVSDSVTLANNPVSISNLADISINEGDLVEIDANFLDLDGDEVTFSCDRTDLFSDFNTGTGVGSWQTDSASSGTYEVTFTVDDGYGSTDSQTITITVNEYSLSTPVLNNTSGNFFVDWSWNSVANVDSYNVSLNDIWTNGTTVTEINNTDMFPHGTSTIQVMAYNATSDVLSDAISDSVTLANNPVLISNLADITSNEGNLVEIDANFLDLDGDEVTFSCDRTDLFGDFNIATGVGSWQTDSSNSGTYEVTFTVDDGYGSTDSQTITITVNEYTLQTPVLSNASGNFFVDWSWNSVANADSYNVSLNGAWTNGTTITEINNTGMFPHGTSTIQVLAYNATSDILSGIVSDSVTLANNPVSISNLADISINEGDLVEIDANFLDLDNDEVTFSCDRTDLFGDFNTATGVGSWQTDSASSGTYEVTFTADDGYGATDSQTITVTVSEYSLSTPVLSNASGNFFVDWSWNSVANADSYNVSLNDIWTNGTIVTEINNTGMFPHGTSTIQILAYNATSDVLSEVISDSVTLANNPVSISNLADISIDEGGLVEIDANFLDLDNDEVTFSCDRTDLFSDFNTGTGVGSWQTDSASSGTYEVTFTVDDGYGSTDSQAITITVNEYSLSTPVLSNVSGNFFVDWSWNSVANADSYNVSLNGVWTNGTAITEINNTDMDAHGTSTIQILAYNATSDVLSEVASDSVTLENNPVSIINLNDISINEGDLVEIDANFLDLDEDEVTFSCDRTDLFGDFNIATGVGSWQTDSSNSGIYEVTFTVDDGYESTDSQTIVITVNEYSLSTPVLSNVSGNFFVDWSWNSVANADSYNVSLNGVWTNGTAITEINNTDMDAHGTSTIQIFAYNATSDVLSDAITGSVTLANNPVSISNLVDITSNEGSLVQINAEFTDLDGDVVTFSCDRTDLFSDFNTGTGVGSWQTDSASSGTYEVTFTVDDGYGSTDSQTITVTVSECSLSTPVLNNASGNFFVDWSWNSVANADSYNVSLNGVWANGTIVTEINNTDMVPHGTSSIQVLAYNATSDVLSEVISDSVTLANNPVSISNLADISIDEGGLVKIDVNFLDLDNDEVTFSCDRTDLFGDFNTATGVGSWQTDSASSGTYEVTFTADDGYGSTDSQTITVTVSECSLSTPVLSNASGNFFVDWSWNSVANADSYNVSLNGVWANGTIVTEINNTDMVPHGTSSIQVLAYNATSDVLSAVASDSVTLENNPVSIINLNDISINEGDLVEIDANFLDLDNDEVTFSCDRTDLFGDFNTGTGTGSWQTDSSNSGTYEITFTVDDGYGSTDSQTLIITVNEYSLLTPVLSNVSGNFFVDWSWDSVVNADSYNVSLNGIWTNGTTITEINNTDMFPHSISEITVFAYNESLDVLSEVICDSVILANNPVSISNLNDINVNELELISINAEYSDLDDDSVTFSCNRIDLFSDFNTSTGEGSWQTDSASSGTYEVTFTVDDGYGSTDSQTITITVSECSLSTPVLSSSTGNFFVDWSWDPVVNADSYNVSLNGAWTNGTIVTEINNTDMEPRSTSNIQVIAYNITSDVLSEAVSDSVTLANNPASILNLVDITSNEGSLIEINAGVTDLDGDSVIFGCNRTDLFGDFNETSGEGSWQTRAGDAGTYDILVTVNDGYDITSQTITITVNEYAIGGSSDLRYITGNFFVDWSWDPVDDADSYNVSLNDGWINGTVETEINNTDMDPHAMSSIQVFAYNVTYNVLSEIVSDSVSLPNNPVTITNLNDITIYEGSLIDINVDFIDLDNDEVIFSCDRTDLFGNFNETTGEGSWQTDSASSGIYEVTFSVDDGYESVDYQTISITVNEYSIGGGDENLSYISGNFFVNWSWQDVAGADYYNVSENGKWVYNGTNTSYDSISLLPHEWSNITIYGYNMTSVAFTELFSEEVQLQNNPVILSNLSDITVLYGNNITIDADYFDLDNDEVTFSCDRTDLFDNFNATDGTGTWVTNYSDIGTYLVIFNVSDEYGSIASKRISIVIKDSSATTAPSSSSSSSGGSGGSGGGGSSAESYENIESVVVGTNIVSKDSIVEYDYDPSEVIVSSITFDALQNLGTVKARVEVLYDQSQFVDESISGVFYHYINIWMDRYRFTEGLHYDNAQISFTVEKEWIEDNNIDVDSIHLNWYSTEEYQEGWKALKTEMTGADEEYYYFKATVSSFSCFAITGNVKEENNSDIVIIDLSENADSSYPEEFVDNDIVLGDIVEEKGGFISNILVSAKDFFAHIFGKDPIENEYEKGTFDWLIEE